jgi:hypothetical protein
MIQSRPSMLGDMDFASFGRAASGFGADEFGGESDLGTDGGDCSSTACLLDDESPDRNGVLRVGFACPTGGGCAEAPQPPGEGTGGVHDAYLCLKWLPGADVPLPPVP